VGHLANPSEHRGRGLKEIAGIIIIAGREPEKTTLAKAEEENIPILLTTLPAFEVVGRLYQMGLSGER
jgi:hypothetical protein